MQHQNHAAKCYIQNQATSFMLEPQDTYGNREDLKTPSMLEFSSIFRESPHIFCHPNIGIGQNA